MAALYSLFFKLFSQLDHLGRWGRGLSYPCMVGGKVEAFSIGLLIYFTICWYY
jgi:hypothetical protein